MSFVDGPSQWRLPIGFQAVFALCLLLQGMVLPDSPRWLIAHGYKEEGARVIAMLEDRDSIDHPDVLRVQGEIEASLAQESAGGRDIYSNSKGSCLHWYNRPFSIQRAIRRRKDPELPQDLLVYCRQCYAAIYGVRFSHLGLSEVLNLLDLRANMIKFIKSVDVS
jgi:hypothetical protein